MSVQTTHEPFAKLFDTANGQLLVYLDETEDGDPAITVIGADVRGVRPSAKLSGWSGGEAGQLLNFAKIDAAGAETLAAQLRNAASSVSAQSEAA